MELKKAIKYKHNPGGSCASVAWSGIFKHQGYNLSEADIFGLGSGLYFGYCAVGESKLFDISLTSPNIVDDLMINTGVRGKLIQHHNNPDCLNLILKSIDNGNPVALLFNPHYCEGLIRVTPDETKKYLPTHWIVVTGYDSKAKTLTSYDNRQFNPIEISFENFMAGRNTGLFDQNPRNFLYNVLFFDNIYPLETSIKLAIQKTCINFLDVEKIMSFYVGSYGFEKCVRQIRQWNLMLSPDQLQQLLQKIYISSTGAGGIKGGYRNLFSKFLENSASILNMPEMYKIADLFKESAYKWNLFVQKVSEYQHEYSELNWGKNSELSNLLQQIYDLEISGFTSLRRITK
jgi:Domain of unknown function (DUF4872)/Butirosin biosynthesis protein H, N-terminal